MGKNTSSPVDRGPKRYGLPYVKMIELDIFKLYDFWYVCMYVFMYACSSVGTITFDCLEADI